MRKRSRLDNFRPAEFVFVGIPAILFVVLGNLVLILLGRHHYFTSPAAYIKSLWKN